MSPIARRSPAHRFRVALTGDGCPGPIEERIGRRLVRLVDPQSEEGQRLLDSEPIEWVGPDGIAAREPSAIGHMAIWSPTTAITDRPTRAPAFKAGKPLKETLRSEH